MNTIINTQILQKQLEIVNAERAVAVKALQQIEDYLRCAEPIEEIVCAYGTAVAALCELDEWEE